MTSRTLLVWLLLSSIVFAGQTRDPIAPKPVGTAVISGIVVAAGASVPLRRVHVNVVAARGTLMSSSVRYVLTDDRGRFELPGLPAGEYSVSATKGGYLRGVYGSSRTTGGGTPVVLADGERVDVRLDLVRGGVIAGRLTDETGAPASDVDVAAFRYQMRGGERAPVPASSLGAYTADRTDDQGAYRLYGLPPGDYLVVATPTFPFGNGTVAPMADGDVRAVLQTGRGASRAGRGTRSSVTSGARVPALGYAPIYFPGSTAVSESSTITIDAGEERPDVDFRLFMVRTARVSGLVTEASGAISSGVQLTLVPAGAAAVLAPTGSRARTTSVSPDGTFSFSGVPPGRHTLSARRGAGNTIVHEVGAVGFIASDGPARIVATRATSGSGGWAEVEVYVDGEDVPNLALTVQPTLTIRGRMSFDTTGGTPSVNPARASVMLEPMTSTNRAPSPRPGSSSIDSSGTFVISNVVPGRYTLSASMPVQAGITATLVSATLDGRDVLDLPIEVRGELAPLELVLGFSSQRQSVSGRLLDGQGRPAPSYTILIFSSDPRHWNAGSRRNQMTKVSTGGRYVFDGLPPGSYMIAPLTEIGPEELFDADFLRSLQNVALPITIAPGEQRVQDFRIGG